MIVSARGEQMECDEAVISFAVIIYCLWRLLSCSGTLINKMCGSVKAVDAIYWKPHQLKADSNALHVWLSKYWSHWSSDDLSENSSCSTLAFFLRMEARQRILQVWSIIYSYNFKDLENSPETVHSVSKIQQWSIRESSSQSLQIVPVRHLISPLN